MKIPGIRWYNLQKLALCIKKCIFTSFVALGMLPEGNTPKKGDQRLVSHCRQCSYTPVGLCQEFLNKELCGNTGAFSILSWPGLSWFLPFLPTEISTEGTALLWCYCIFRNATDKLNRISQNWFQECFQRLYNCRQSSTDVKGEYFEGNVASVIGFFCITRK
jgi:hypothetical protein